MMSCLSQQNDLNDPPRFPNAHYTSGEIIPLEQGQVTEQWNSNTHRVNIHIVVIRGSVD